MAAAQSLLRFIQKWEKTERDIVSLEGGALNSVWWVAGASEPILVKRRDPLPLPESASLMDEFLLQDKLYKKGAKVAEALDCDGEYFAMRAVTHFSEPVSLREEMKEGEGERLVASLGAHLAHIHGMKITEHDVRSFPLEGRWQEMQDALDSLPGAYPVLEWALQILQDRAPSPVDPALCHRDFRMGNILFSPQSHELAAIIDWEFAGLGDPYEDLGWFCARCWRFGNVAAQAGGMGSKEAFCKGYEGVTGKSVDRERMQFWEDFAALRWAIIALQQGERYRKGASRKIDLALTPLRAIEAAYDLIQDLAHA